MRTTRRAPHHDCRRRTRGPAPGARQLAQEKGRFHLGIIESDPNSAVCALASWRFTAFECWCCRATPPTKTCSMRRRAWKGGPVPRADRRRRGQHHVVPAGQAHGRQPVLALISRRSYADLMHGTQIDIACRPRRPCWASCWPLCARAMYGGAQPARRGVAEALEIVVRGDRKEFARGGPQGERAAPAAAMCTSASSCVVCLTTRVWIRSAARACGSRRAAGDHSAQLHGAGATTMWCSSCRTSAWCAKWKALPRERDVF